MTRDDEARVDAVERVGKPLVRRRVGQDRLVATRRRVAVENAVELDRGRPRTRPLDGVSVEVREHPVVRLAVAVPTNELRVHRADELERLGRLRAEEYVAAEHDRVDAYAVDLGQDGLERARHRVDVVERCDAVPLPVMVSHLYLVDDLEDDALSAPPVGRPRQLAECARDSALLPDHLADVVLRDEEPEQHDVVTLLPLEANRFGLVDEAAYEVLQQLSQCSWP